MSLIAVSFKKELLLIFGTLAFIIILPLISVVMIANAGVVAVSSALAFINPTTNKVEIHDPNGLLISELTIMSNWPVEGVVTAEFGVPTLYQEHHTGIDIADPMGEIGRPVTVFMEGTVIKVSNLDDANGRYVSVDNGNHIVSQYWHLSLAIAKVGQYVKPGDVIGLEGSTGRSTGPHVHFEIDVFGIPVNPRSFIIGSPPLGYDDGNN